jgi:hypothetical protein
VGIDTSPLYARYRSIQLALGHAIREVHLPGSQVPDRTLEAIRSVLEKFEWVFTTSYDLLVYWAMAYGGHFKPFVDCFRWGGRCEFDPHRSITHCSASQLGFGYRPHILLSFVLRSKFSRGCPDDWQEIRTAKQERWWLGDLEGGPSPRHRPCCHAEAGSRSGAHTCSPRGRGEVRVRDRTGKISDTVVVRSPARARSGR